MKITVGGVTSVIARYSLIPNVINAPHQILGAENKHCSHIPLEPPVMGKKNLTALKKKKMYS